MQKNIVITGATGRIGTALSENFYKSSQVRLFPVSTQSKEGFYSYDNLLTNAFLRSVDVILHLAWSSVPKVSEENFGNEWHVDIPLLVRMLQAIRSGEHKHIHFIFFSSAGTVYGNQDGDAVKETTPCNPVNLYGWSKLHAEQLLQQFAIRFALSVTILRISNIYGIDSHINDQQGVIPIIIKSALNNSEFCVWGDGSSQKDYFYISDLIEVVDIMIEKRVTGLFNVCFGQSYSLNEIIQQVEFVTGKKVMLRYSTALSWDNRSVRIDGRKLCESLAWKPKINIENGVKKMLI